MAARHRGASFAKSMIAVDLQTFRQRREGANVTGVVFLELQDELFPEKGWSDFPVIILGWWTEAWLQLQVSTRREVQWRFMDGPYAVTVTKTEGAASAGAFEFSQVRSSLLEAGERVVAHCHQYGMLSKDLDFLRAHVQLLKANQTVQRAEASRSAYVEIRPSVAAGSSR